MRRECGDKVGDRLVTIKKDYKRGVSKSDRNSEVCIDRKSEKKRYSKKILGV